MTLNLTTEQAALIAATIKLALEMGRVSGHADTLGIEQDEDVINTGVCELLEMVQP